MSTELVPQPEITPAAIVSESVELDLVKDDNEVWVVFPGEEPHWEPVDWTETIEDNSIPWWLFAMWGVYAIWGIWYIIYGSSQW